MRRLLLALILLMQPVASHAGEALPRKLLAFYDSRQTASPRPTFIHRFLEMPANHLGYDIRYHDVTRPLPKLDDETHGIVVWFDNGVEVPDPAAFLTWLLTAHAKGKKILLIETLGVTERQLAKPDIAEKYHALMATLGIRDDMEWYPLTYQAQIVMKDESMVGFERNFGPSIIPFGSTHALPGMADVHLRIRPNKDKEAADLIVTNANGGYVADGYAVFIRDLDNPNVTQWYIDPFAFLRKTLDVPHAPVPDVTTLDGRRIFYSHIDGDGWNNLSEIPVYSRQKTLSAEVIYKEILEPYSDFAFNVGLITADVDPACYGVEGSEQIAQAIFALPNVEPSSHTHSHPLFWRFFASYDIEKEKPFLAKYPTRPIVNKSLTSALAAQFDDPFGQGGKAPHHTRGHDARLGKNDESNDIILSKYYDTPRSYACSPYDLEQEIKGSIARVKELSPPGKKVMLVQWSGDTTPYEEALKETRKAGFLNINGGDSRFDREYPSYAWVAPIGLQVGRERQIYSSNSNENTYTNLWTGRFFGFRYLQTTVENTEHPLRVTPFNLYFHIYSGQKQASLDALKANLEYARHQMLIPITASHYAAMANGFYSTRIVPAGKYRWEIHNRGDLQNLRMDNAVHLKVDIHKSQGVIGFRHYQNNMYIALDPAVKTPVIQLTNNDNIENPPFLVESSWLIKDLQISKKTLTFAATGYGPGHMIWQASPHETFAVTVTHGTETVFENQLSTDDNGFLTINLSDVSAIAPVTITMSR